MIQVYDKPVSPYVFPGLKFEQDNIIKRKTFTEETVIRSVCQYFNTTEKIVKATSNLRRVVYPRQCAIYILCYYSNLSVTEIAERFPKRHPKQSKRKNTNIHHSTIIHSRERIKEDIRTYPEKKFDIDKIIDLCTSEGFMTIKDFKNGI